MRIVNNEDEFKKAWDDARREAGAAFGNDGLYLEKFIEEPRHIEIQIVGDQYGKVCHLSERDCSIQRRHQKLVEETPSPAVSQELREKMGEAAIKGKYHFHKEKDGRFEVTVSWNVDKETMQLQGERLGSDAMRLEGKHETTTYWYIGRMDGGELVLRYLSVDGKAGKSGSGESRLTRAK